MRSVRHPRYHEWFHGAVESNANFARLNEPVNSGEPAFGGSSFTQLKSCTTNPNMMVVYPLSVHFVTTLYARLLFSFVQFPLNKVNARKYRQSL
jgi:hypothetical protein